MSSFKTRSSHSLLNLVPFGPILYCGKWVVWCCRCPDCALSPRFADCLFRCARFFARDLNRLLCVDFGELNIEFLRSIRIERIGSIRSGRFVSPMFVHPKPLFRLFSNNRLELIPASLSDCPVRSAFCEFQRRQQAHKISAVRARERDEWDDGYLRSFV